MSTVQQHRERPILFSGPMVRAILEGQKTVTRRAVKPCKAHADGFAVLDFGNGWQPFNTFCDFTSDSEGMEYPIACPYGKPGDRLWVRETFATLSAGQYEPVKPAWGYGQDLRFAATDPLADCDIGVRGYAWRPSIHMPRWASRILLEVTDVRVERLQDISEHQAQAEGIEHLPHLDPAGTCHWRVYGSESSGTNSPVASFESLWESINGAGSWDANPWVWVVEFRRIQP
ncbi:hypothetical protein PSm6_44250 [Pseudomonas solani]|uniref:Morphogenetic protein n=2 Tax=Pseudomonas solani TaxID=2731552 RepID=A0ABM7LEM4_9PSED|nr:hypothetical protein [Pseudomonas solani]BCD88018.1 hypothetical protein PSm6_44250 [Pseudomonas solani]